MFIFSKKKKKKLTTDQLLPDKQVNATTFTITNANHGRIIK